MRIPVFAPLCGINAPKKYAFYLRGVVGIEIVLSMLSMKRFFVLLMQRAKRNLEIDVAPTITMSFLKGGESCCSCGAVHAFLLT